MGLTLIMNRPVVEAFVTRKISRGLCNIHQGLETCLYLGNLDASRDWGHAKDYINMQWLMLQQNHPEICIIATGIQYSVREILLNGLQMN